MTNDIPDPMAPFIVPVDGVGTFTFARRSLRNQFKIEVVYAELTEGVAIVTPFLANLAQSVADLAVLTVSGPKGWQSKDEILDKDAADPAVYDQIRKVWSALCDKEAAFRGPVHADGGKETGAGSGGVDGTVVSPQVQPGAD